MGFCLFLAEFLIVLLKNVKFVQTRKNEKKTFFFWQNKVFLPFVPEFFYLFFTENCKKFVKSCKKCKTFFFKQTFFRQKDCF